MSTRRERTRGGRLGRAAASAAAASAVVACGTAKPTAPAAGRALPDSAEQVMFGLRTQQTTAGVRKSVLYADTGFFYNDNTLIDLRRVRVVFYSAAGDSNAVMIGRTGRYDTRTQRVEGRGDVVVTSTDGRRLTSPHLVYERALNQITSDTNFVFTEPGRTLQGIGFRSDPQLRNVQVLRRAQARSVLPPPSESRAGAASNAPAIAPAPVPATPTAPVAAPAGPPSVPVPATPATAPSGARP